MANEITLTFSLNVTLSDGTSETVSLSSLGIDVAGSQIIHNKQTVGFAAEEALLLGDVGVGGYLVAINRDSTNFVEIRPATGETDLVQLLPGEPAIFRVSPDATAPFVQADTGNVELEYWLIEL